MGLLAVNLKHYYQRRGLWLWYLFILSQSAIWVNSLLDGRKSGSFFESNNRAIFFGYAMVTFFPGCVIGTMLKETISKPFSFCMPGHREVSRKVVFLIGSVVSVLLSFVFVSCPVQTFGHVLLVMLAGGFIAMGLYLLGAMFAMASPKKTGVLNILFIVIYGLIFWGGGKGFGGVLLSYPAAIILMGVVVCIAAWQQLGREPLARENCGKLFIGMMDGYNMEKKRRYREEVLKAKMGKRSTGIFSGLEEFFLGRMARCEFLSLGRYVWGHVYSVMGRSFGSMRWCNLVILPILLVVGYLGCRGFRLFENLFFVMPVMVTIMVDLNAYPTVLVPGGRREQFWGTVVSGVTITVAAVVLVSVFAVVSMWLGTILPDITVKGCKLEYGAMDISKLSLLLIFMPLSLAVGMLFPRSMIAKFAVIIIMSQVWFVGSTLSQFDSFKPIAAINNPVSIAVIITAVWLFYLWAIARHFRRAQLV